MAEYTFPKYDSTVGGREGFNWGSTFTEKLDYPFVNNIFEGRAPSIDTAWKDMKLDPNVFNAQYSYSDSADQRSKGPSWLNTGLEALNKALAYKDQTGGSSSGSRSYRGYGSSAPAVSQGRGYTMYMPAPTQKTTQSGGSRGIGSAIGTIAGIGASFIPGVGAAAAAAMPAAGGALGSLFG
jgi:hypothetical protein